MSSPYIDPLPTIVSKQAVLGDSGINTALIQEMQARQERQRMEMAMQPQIHINQTMDRQIDAMDALNNNIVRLCNLLETLQLSVLPRD